MVESKVIGARDCFGIEGKVRLVQSSLEMYLGDAEKAENQLFRVPWTAVCSNRLDTKALQEQEPEIYQKYLKQTNIRRFTVKAS